jgi:hypothetical protein
MTFADTVVQFSTSVTADMVEALSAKHGPAWLRTAQGQLTSKVFLRKYLLRCWEVYLDDRDSTMAQFLHRIVTEGQFEHLGCMFTCLFTITYQHYTWITRLLTPVVEPTHSPTALDLEHLGRLLQTVAPPLLTVLQNTDVRCTTEPRSPCLYRPPSG